MSKTIKKTVAPNIIFTFILISIAVTAGIYLMSTFEKNKIFIQSQQFPQSFEVGIYVKYYVQDPELVQFYLSSNYPTKTYLIYKITSDSLEYQEELVVTGLTKIERNLSEMFNISPSALDGKILDIIVKTDKGPQGFDSISLSLSTKILNINTNVPSYTQTNVLSNLYPGNNILYLETNPTKAKWMDLYQIKTINLNTTKKLENLNLTEDFNIQDFTFTFLDANTSEPIVGGSLYLNNFFVGYTDSNGNYDFKYHKNSEAIVELTTDCYYLNKKVNVTGDITFFVNNFCRYSGIYSGSYVVNNSTNGSSSGTGTTNHIWSLRIVNLNSYDLVNYQLRVNISSVKTTTLTFYVIDSNSNYVNYTFEKSDGEFTNNPLEWDTDFIWIKIPYLPAASTLEFRIFEDTTSHAKTADQVFDFYDDFEDGVIDNTKWDVFGSATEELDSSYHTGALKGSGGNRVTWVCSKITFNGGYLVNFRMRPTNSGDFDSGISIGNLYFISDTGVYGGHPCISTSLCYPSGSQGSDTTYHDYEVKVVDGSQYIKDLTSGGQRTATYSYTSGPLCLVGDSDNSARKTLYDFIYVRKYADIEPTYTITQIS
jgi:hypothetical protein